MSDYELKRINALPEASAINDSDVFAIDSAAGTKKVAWETLKGEVDADITEAVSNKADKDGTYPDMAVGSVLGTNTETDREPYFIRPSASIGDREFDTLVGGTLGWNQQVNASELTGGTNNGITVTANTTTGEITVSGTASGSASVALESASTISTTPNHVYFMAQPTGASASTFFVRTGEDTFWNYHTIAKSTLEIETHTNLRMIVGSGQTVNSTFKPQFIDLTTLFGSTIADYIYSLETANAGDGVAWVRKYLPNTYYAYCAPTLKHVSGVSAHVMRDANNNVIGNYPIDSTWVGMGIPKLDSDGKLYFDGDTYASDGTVTEKFGIVDLGTVNYVKNTASGYSYYSTSETAISDRKAGSSMMICAKYVVVAPDRDALASADKTLASYNSGNSKAIAIRDDSVSDASALKTALSGTYLVYEKATPTTSSASPFTSPQICDPNGTEEYVTTGLVPVGHETEYVENLADKLTDIPDLPTTAGTYRLKVTVSGGVPSYSWVSA